MTQSPWTPDSWLTKPAGQQPSYPDQRELDVVMSQLSRLPPLVTSWEVEALKSKLALAGQGKAFILQGGDCAESFDDCQSSVIAAKIKILLQMSLILTHGTRRNVVRIGRFAGQYAKPRSTDTETIDGVTLPSYRGDLINKVEFSKQARTPDPHLLLRGYERAALTLNFIRSLSDGGFADIRNLDHWDLSFVKNSETAAEYEKLASSIRDSIEFMEAMTGTRLANMKRVDFFTSHEGLSLHYEQAQTRQVPRHPGWYNLSTHLPWIGKRTAELDGAHVEYFRGIKNPIGIKISADVEHDRVIELIERLNPSNEPGRLVLIHRFGADLVRKQLPPMLEAVNKADKAVTWISDPMHGNTEMTESGIKTRRFESILREVEESFAAHAEAGTILAGIHFELTGEDVTECMGGARGLVEADLKRAYTSRVDPRLNYEQALEIALNIATHMRKDS